MGARIFSVDYYLATLEDRPGEGSKFLSWLASEEVNLLAFNACPLGDGMSRITIYPVNPIYLGHAARKKGYRLDGPHHAFIVHGDDELGALLGIHSRLADAKINVSTSNGIVDGRGGYRYILHVEPKDFEKAREILDVEQDPEAWRKFTLNIFRRFEAAG